MIIAAKIVLLTAAPVLPVALVATWLLPYLRKRMSLLLVIAPLPALAISLLAAEGPSITFWRGLVPLTLALDVPRSILLGVCSLLWIVAAVYVASKQRNSPISYQFAVCWLLTLAGNIGVFVTADLASFFLSYTLVSIPAYGLIAHDDTPSVRHAGAIYMAYTVLGETILLMAFALLAAARPGSSLLIQDLVAALPRSPWRGPTVALLIAGFGMKIGLVPLHAWMPRTYRAAPVPAAAVLSGAAVKAGVIGLIRFLPFGVVLPDAGTALVVAGFVGAFYGVAVGLTQTNAKVVLAYSSISQMGVISAVLGVALTAGNTEVAMPVAFYAAHHVLVKGSLFIAVGLAIAGGPRRPSIVLLPAVVLALGLGGLPLTGGALSKLALKAPLGSGFVSVLSNLSAAATTLLMLHFIHRLTTESAARDSSAVPVRVAGTWLALAAASVAIPWILYPLATGSPRISALAPAALWASFWPVLLGTLLAGLIYWWRDRIPQVPYRYAGSTRIVHATARCSQAIEGLEGEFRRWPVASLSLLVAGVLLGVAMMVAR
jgi:formate hydrogenlyase subunit 3/multisubunit Na+/H+ antiporter MnhD subunit